MRALVVSSRFPDAVRPIVGNIMERQTLALAQRPGVEVQVVAPIPVPPFPLSLSARHRRLRDLPVEEIWKGLRVHRPRYTVLPKLAGLHPYLMRHLLPLLTGRTPCHRWERAAAAGTQSPRAVAGPG